MSNLKSLGLLACFFVSSVSHAATVTLTPSADLLGIGDVFSVTVSVSDFPETAGVTSRVLFDETVVHFTGMRLAVGSPLDFILPPFGDGNTSGITDLFTVLAPFSGALPSGNFDAFIIDFITVAGGETEIALLGDPLGWVQLDFTYVPDLISINANVAVSDVPVPAAAWLFGSGLIGLVGMARRKTA